MVPSFVVVRQQKQDIKINVQISLRHILVGNVLWIFHRTKDTKIGLNLRELYLEVIVRQVV